MLSEKLEERSDRQFLRNFQPKAFLVLKDDKTIIGTLQVSWFLMCSLNFKTLEQKNKENQLGPSSPSIIQVTKHRINLLVLFMFANEPFQILK